MQSSLTSKEKKYLVCSLKSRRCPLFGSNKWDEEKKMISSLD